MCSKLTLIIFHDVSIEDGRIKSRISLNNAPQLLLYDTVKTASACFSVISACKSVLHYCIMYLF